jgi:hypothetical protein
VTEGTTAERAAAERAGTLRTAGKVRKTAGKAAAGRRGKTATGRAG